MQPGLPDWVIDGMRLVQEHEALQARARAAWRRHRAREAQEWSLAAHRVASLAAGLERQLHNARESALSYPKPLSRRFF
jgi:hypothetical protein